MSRDTEMMQAAREKADERIDKALGALRAAAREIGKQFEIPENISGHSTEELLGRMCWVPSQARDLRRACGQELANLELKKLFDATPAAPLVSSVPNPEAFSQQPSKAPENVPVGRDLSDLSGVTVQAVKALKAGGYMTVGDVMAVPDEHLVKLPGIAEKSLAQVRAAIRKAAGE